MAKLRIPTLSFRVAYWTKRDDDNCACAPSGLQTVHFYSDISESEAIERIENRRQFKRGGRCTVYDIESLQKL